MAQVESKNRATSDPGARKDVLKEIKERGIEDVLLWFTDIEGHLKSFSITTSEVEGALDDGMGFDGSSVTGFNAIEESDMVAIPDPATFRILPDGVSGRLICDVVTPDGEPFGGDPRHVLRLALERMQAMGFDTFNVGPEAEYFLFRDDKGTETLDEGGYFAQTTMDAATTIRRDTIRALEQMGIPVEYHHHEVGPSQHEIDIRFTGAADMADFMLTYRLVVKEVAKQHGYHATFMPKPLFGENGSGMHTHQSLFAGGRNMFFDADDKWHLSDNRQGIHRRPAPPRARDHGRVRAVGQLLQAARAGLRGAGLRRLVAAQPLGADPDPALQARLGERDPGRAPLPRSGLQPVSHLRVPASRRPRGDRAGLRAARSDGDEPLPPDPEQRRERGIVSLPEDPGRGDRRALPLRARQKALGPHIFDRYIELKRKEWDEYRVQLTDWEMKKYLPVL